VGCVGMAKCAVVCRRQLLLGAAWGTASIWFEIPKRKSHMVPGCNQLCNLEHVNTDAALLSHLAEQHELLCCIAAVCRCHAEHTAVLHC
jgi:hypothetical protein